MANNEFAGSALFAQWIWSGGTIEISTKNRNFSYNESGETIDVTSGADTTRRKIASFKSATAAMTYAAQNDGTALLAACAFGVAGTLIFGEAGSAVGKPKTTLPAISLGVSRSVPYADAVTWDLSWEANGAPTYGAW